MTCSNVRKLFAAYWDDETTQAEREWLEAHFAACPRCRSEYEAYSRTLECVASLPRAEAAPDLVERVLARTRRSRPAPDRVPATGLPWVPATAALALVLVIGTLVVGPWMARRDDGRIASTTTVAPEAPSAIPTPAGEPVATSVPVPLDSLFDDSDEVEFILDPVTLRRGRASVTRPSEEMRVEQAVISF